MSVCGKSNGHWFGKRTCELESGHRCWHSWHSNAEYNSLVDLFYAAEFEFDAYWNFGDPLREYTRGCPRCSGDSYRLNQFKTSVAPSGFQARVVAYQPLVCFRCAEVRVPRVSVSEYLAPFLAKNQSPSNNEIINQAIERMQADIVKLRSCLKPEPMGAPYRSA